MPKNDIDKAFSGGQEMTTKQMTFGKVGDWVKGTFSNKKVVKTARGEVALYELKASMGVFHEMDADKKPVEPAIDIQPGSYYTIFGGKQAIDDLFARSKFGDIVALQFKDAVPSKTKGNSPFKVFKTLTFGKDPDFMGESSDLQEAAEEVLPPKE